MFQHRHSPCSILRSMESVQKEHNISLKHYEITRLEKFSSFPLYIHHYVSTQTLTMLDLAINGISAEGAQHLAQALQNNKVGKIFFFSTIYSPLCFNTDSNHARS